MISGTVKRASVPNRNVLTDQSESKWWTLSRVLSSNLLFPNNATCHSSRRETFRVTGSLLRAMFIFARIRGPINWLITYFRRRAVDKEDVASSDEGGDTVTDWGSRARWVDAWKTLWARQLHKFEAWNAQMIAEWTAKRESANLLLQYAIEQRVRYYQQFMHLCSKFIQ